MSKPPIMCRRTPTGLKPATAFDEELLDGYALGAELEVTIKQRRSNQHHRWFFQFLSKVVASGATPFRRAEQLLDAVKFEIGLTEIMRTMDGKYLVRPSSVSFSAMDQAEFTRFSEEAIAAIAEHYGVHPDEVMAA